MRFILASFYHLKPRLAKPEQIYLYYVSMYEQDKPSSAKDYSALSTGKV